MIVKNEEVYLSKCIESVQHIVDEIIIVDTGSTDQTIAIAKKYGAKIFHFQWVNDFSKARNFAIEQATSTWLLLLDGDEVLDAKSKDTLIQFINTTTLDGCHFIMHNYIGKEPHSQFTIHYPLRLIRNNHNYRFKGAIHEQLTSLNGTLSSERFSVEDILVHHYGYVDSTLLEKDKRSRNIPILLKQLETDPHNAFHLFNLGNEYLCLGEIHKAIETYEHAREYAIPTQAATPYLYHRLIISLITIKNYTHALEIAEAALILYPMCTDMHYAKAIVHYHLHHYTLAIDCLNKCIELGDPHISLKFTEGCGTYLPYLLLGEIYNVLEDYKKALNAYTHAINVNPSLFNCLYTIGDILNKLYTDKHLVTQYLQKYFSNLEYGPNLIVFIDILLTQQLYQNAEPFLNRLDTISNDSVDKYYLWGKYYFYNKQYTQAYECFQNLSQKPLVSTTLPNIYSQSMLFLFIIDSLDNKKTIDYYLPFIKFLNTPILEHVLLQFHSLYSKEETVYFQTNIDTQEYLNCIIDYLDKLLKVHEFDFFEKSLYIFNYIDSKEVLIELSKLYSTHGLDKMVVNTILQSIKELNTITKESAYILYKHLN